MAINYVFNVGSVTKVLEHEGLSDIIVKVSFSVNAQTDSTEVASFSYSCGGHKDFPIAEIDPENFLDFEAITLEIVVGWLLASEGVSSLDDFSYVKASVDNIRARLYELQERVDASLPGSGLSSIGGSVTSEIPPAPPAPPAPTPSFDESILQTEFL